MRFITWLTDIVSIFTDSFSMYGVSLRKRGRPTSIECDFDLVAIEVAKQQQDESSSLFLTATPELNDEQTEAVDAPNNTDDDNKEGHAVPATFGIGFKVQMEYLDSAVQVRSSAHANVDIDIATICEA